MKRYAILQSISQREDGTLSEESAELARIAHDIIRAGASRSKDERESTDSSINVVSLFILHNIIFPDSAYSFVGFTGFSGRSIFPVVRQCYIEGGLPATQNEIDCYMAALGFDKVDKGKFKNSQYLLSDLLPKNAIRDVSGDIFIIDAEISMI